MAVPARRRLGTSAGRDHWSNLGRFTGRTSCGSLVEPRAGHWSNLGPVRHLIGKVQPAAPGPEQKRSPKENAPYIYIYNIYIYIYIYIYQSEGVSSERDIWSLCVFACWWLWGVAVVGSPSSSLSASLPGFFRLTFWPRFYHPRNYQRNQAEKKMGGNAARLFAQSFDARLAGIVI